MRIECDVDQDEFLDKMSSRKLIDYIKNTCTLKDVLAEWMKVNRHQLTEEMVIEFIKEEL
jgi:ribosomal protein S18